MREIEREGLLYMRKYPRLLSSQSIHPSIHISILYIYPVQLHHILFINVILLSYQMLSDARQMVSWIVLRYWYWREKQT